MSLIYWNAREDSYVNNKYGKSSSERIGKRFDRMPLNTNLEAHEVFSGKMDITDSSSCNNVIRYMQR